MNVECSDYRFDFDMRGTTVTFKTARLGGGDVTNEDEQWVTECMSDLGKWETVKKAFLDLISGVDLAKNALEIKAYTVKSYNIETKFEEGTVRGSVRLSEEERRLRNAKGEGSISVEEVARQLRNVDKWRNMQRAISSLRSK